MIISEEFGVRKFCQRIIHLNGISETHVLPFSLIFKGIIKMNLFHSDFHTFKSKSTFMNYKTKFSVLHLVSLLEMLLIIAENA